MATQENTTNILRQLGGSELLYDKDIANCGFLNSRVFRISTKIDIYSRIDLLQEAFVLWKDAHHFLRCNIVRNSDGRKCFAYAPESLVNSMENVNFLSFNSKRPTDEIWRLFLERELSTGMDSSKLLWRLTLIQVISTDGNNNEAGSFDYYLAFTANHAIIDGRNVIQVLTQLFSFLERLHLGKKVEYQTYDVMPALDEHPEVVEHKLKSASKSEEPHKDIFPMPANMAHQNPYVPFTIFALDTDDVFLTHDGKVFATYTELAEQNKETFNAVQALVFEQDIFLKLLKKCKAHNTKLTGCLNIIAILATQQTIKHFSQQDTNSLYFATTVSMRAHLTPPIDLYRMGYCSLLFEADFNEHIRFDDSDCFWSEQFWKYAQPESEAIHRRLDNHEYIDIVSVDSEYIDTFKFEKLPGNPFKYHFVLSNRGDMTDVVTTENKLFEFVETFSGMGFGKDNQAQLFLHLIESIHKTLFWSVIYNKNILKDEVAQFHYNFIDNAVRRLID